MLFLPIIVSLFALVFAYFLIREIRKAPSGSGKQIEIQKAIREGVMIFWKRQFKTTARVVVFLFFLLWLTLGLKVGLGFLIGALASTLAGFIGILVSTQANLKVVEAAKTGLKEAFKLSFQGASVTGFSVVGLGLLVVSAFFLLTQDLMALIGLSFGASLISVFVRLGGGIYIKAADIGDGLIGEIEKGISENNPRNPALIAGQVGDNIGDCAGMAADLFETYVIAMTATMILTNFLFPDFYQTIFLPLILGSLALIASIFFSFFVKLRKNGEEQFLISPLYKGLIGAGVLSAIGFFPIIFQVAPFLKLPSINLYLATLIGLLMAAFIFLITDYFTSKKHSPVKSIVLASQVGYGSKIITGLSVGMKSTLLPVILISVGILISFALAGLYGLAISLVSMLSLTGLIMALNSFGPITNNASRISEMAGLDEEVRKNTEALEAVGNTTKTMAKGYAAVSAGLAALILFFVYSQELEKLGAKINFFLADPQVLVGLFLGGVISYYFASLIISALGKTASKVVEEVRRQFREIKGLMEGKDKSEDERYVDIVAKAAIKEMIIPAFLPVAFSILVGFILGPEVLGGLLIGSIIVGIFLALSMTSGGAAWDKAKKLIEEENLGEKRGFAPEVVLTGDTDGRLYKDTIGPAINPMIKILNLVALLIVGFLV